MANMAAVVTRSVRDCQGMKHHNSNEGGECRWQQYCVPLGLMDHRGAQIKLRLQLGSPGNKNQPRTLQLTILLPL